MSNPNRLTTKEVARICRVSDATVKRWAIAGFIDSEKTSGGHRRFRAEDVAKFQTDQGLGGDGHSRSDGFVTAHKRSKMKSYQGSDLFVSMVSGCEEDVANILIKDYLDGMPLETIFDTRLAKELDLVGRQWKRGALSVAEEHLATRSTAYALFKLRTVIPTPERVNKVAITCAVEGDHHGLVTELARMIFESCGWSVLNFGPNTPFFSLKNECSNEHPSIVCISASILSEVERLSNDYNEFLKGLEPETEVLLGGRAFVDKDIRVRFPADLYLSSLSDLAEHVRRVT